MPGGRGPPAPPRSDRAALARGRARRRLPGALRARRGACRARHPSRRQARQPVPGEGAGRHPHRQDPRLRHRQGPPRPRSASRRTVRASTTTAGGLLGSPLYMSPEQVQSSRDVDHRTDLWSLGCVLYTALTGRAPYQHLESVGQILHAICVSPPPPLSEVAPWLPPALAAAVLAALELRPASRYPDAATMARRHPRASPPPARSPTTCSSPPASARAPCRPTSSSAHPRPPRRAAARRRLRRRAPGRSPPDAAPAEGPPSDFSHPGGRPGAPSDWALRGDEITDAAGARPSAGTAPGPLALDARPRGRAGSPGRRSSARAWARGRERGW